MVINGGRSLKASNINKLNFKVILRPFFNILKTKALNTCLFNLLNMVRESMLKAGLTEYIEGGLDEEAKGRFKLAFTAYFKAITQICDLLIQRKIGKTPSNHTERFRLLESYLPDVYTGVNEFFNTYRDTYSKSISKEACLLVKDEIKRIIKVRKLEKELKEVLQKIQG